MAAQEIVLRFRGDPAQIKTVISDVRTSYGRMVTEVVSQQARAAREVAAINAQTARQADQQSRIQERAAKRLADKKVREGRRALREIEKQLAEEVRAHRRAALESERAAAASQQRRSALFAGAAGGVTALIGLSAVSEIRNAASAWVDYSSKLENTKIAFTTMLGSAQLAEQHLKQLQQFALTTPFQFSDLIDASQRMQALGFNAQEVLPILSSVGDAVSAAGGGSERLDRVVLALSQIQSKGKVATQELNQLAESGISGWKILEEQLGKSRAELVKLVEAGEISSKTFLDAFQAFSKQNFGGLMEAQSKTFTGAMSNIKDALLQTSATAFKPLYERISETARELAKLSTTSKEFQENLTTAGNQVIQVWDGLVEVFHVVRDALGLVGAVAVQVFGGLTHVILATVEAVRGFYFGLQAVGRFMAGDFRGALESANKSTQATENAADELTQALRAQGAVAQQVVSIWENAEARKAAASISAAQKIAAAQLGSTYSGPDRTGGSLSLNAGLQPGAARSIGIPRGGGGGGGGGAAKISEGQRLLNQLQDEHNRLTAKANELSKVQIVALEILDKKYKDLSGSVRHQILEKAAEIDVAQKSIDADKRKEQATEKIRQFLERQTQAIREAQISTDEYADAVTKLEADVLREYGLRIDANTRKMLLENAAVEKALTLTRKRIALEKTRIEMMERERLVTPERKQEQLEREQGIERSTGEETRDRRVNPDVSVWDAAIGALEERIGNLQEPMKAFHDAANLYVVGAFHGMAEAATSAIEAWILYGGSLGKALKQAVAAELAAVAARAAVQAMLHAAYAIGSLAFGNFAAAAQHGIAAAKFAAIAALTGVAARGLAGSAAASSGSATASSAFQSATRVGSGSTAPPVTDVNRRANAQPTAGTSIPAGGELVVTIKPKDGWFGEEFRKDYTLNGVTRLIIKSDGQG